MHKFNKTLTMERNSCLVFSCKLIFLLANIVCSQITDTSSVCSLDTKSNESINCSNESYIPTTTCPQMFEEVKLRNGNIFCIYISKNNGIWSNDCLQFAVTKSIIQLSEDKINRTIDHLRSKKFKELWISAKQLNTDFEFQWTLPGESLYNETRNKNIRFNPNLSSACFLLKLTNEYFEVVTRNCTEKHHTVCVNDNEHPVIQISENTYLERRINSSTFRLQKFDKYITNLEQRDLFK